jgi:hypothetical protein
MQPCTRIYYSNVYQLLNMFRATHLSSSGAQNCNCSLWFYVRLWVPAAVKADLKLASSQSALTVETGQFPVSLNSGRHTQTYVKLEAAIIFFELLMMSGVSLETC